MIRSADSSWHEILEYALKGMSQEYLEFLKRDENYFPKYPHILNAFRLPLSQTKYILFGQDPYPREESAIGWAFIDGRVKNIFSQNGFSKEVNRATSLRNFLKMALVAENLLDDDLSQSAISKIDKSPLIKSIFELRDNFEKNGVLLLNMGLVFSDKKDSKKHIKEWRGFVCRVLSSLENEDIKLILFGNIAKEVAKLDEAKSFQTHLMPHPYNISFIRDQNALNLFAPMHLLNLRSRD